MANAALIGGMLNDNSNCLICRTRNYQSHRLAVPNSPFGEPTNGSSQSAHALSRVLVGKKREEPFPAKLGMRRKEDLRGTIDQRLRNPG